MDVFNTAVSATDVARGVTPTRLLMGADQATQLQPDDLERLAPRRSWPAATSSFSDCKNDCIVSMLTRTTRRAPRDVRSGLRCSRCFGERLVRQMPGLRAGSGSSRTVTALNGARLSRQRAIQRVSAKRNRRAYRAGGRRSFRRVAQPDDRGLVTTAWLDTRDGRGDR
jgi:hypothetical protein